MKRKIVRVYILPVLFLICVLFAGASGEVSFPSPEAASDCQIKCDGRAADCAEPAKYLGSRDGCACFACSYGKPEQKTICSKDIKEKEALLMKVKENPN